MTTTFDEAVTLVEQLSPVEQARLVVLLAERLQHTLSGEAPPATSSAPADTDEPAFWDVPAIDAEWAALERIRAEPHRTGDVVRAETQAMLTRWFGTPLREEDALDHGP